ncbi:MAG TPA: hypothetical protein P5289_07590, partial [Bacteroidales bacterium]|nr:hypothetical protein [Bacteroidales bacterium]
QKQLIKFVILLIIISPIFNVKNILKQFWFNNCLILKFVSKKSGVGEDKKDSGRASNYCYILKYVIHIFD